jgi:hypothetical protein
VGWIDVWLLATSTLAIVNPRAPDDEVAGNRVCGTQVPQASNSVRSLVRFRTGELLRTTAQMRPVRRSPSPAIILGIPKNTGTAHKKCDAKHDGHVGDVENARSDWTDAEV